MEDCAPFAFLESWALVVVYLCSKFRIFDGPILEEYVSHVEKGPHLFQSCLCVMRNGLFLATKKMHPFFESLIIIGTSGL